MKLPAYIEIELIQIGASDTFNQFRIGDLINELKVIAAKEFIPLDEVYQEVARCCQKSKNTVRRYAPVSEKYPINIRRDFENLSFDHFASAMMFGEKDIEALTWASETQSSVDAMTFKFLNPEQAFTDKTEYIPPTEQEWQGNVGVDFGKTEIDTTERSRLVFMINVLKGLVGKIEPDTQRTVNLAIVLLKRDLKL